MSIFSPHPGSVRGVCFHGALAAVMFSCCLSGTSSAQVANALADAEAEQAVVADDGFVRDGAWEYNANTRVYRRKITLAPQLEAKPALSVRFLPTGTDVRRGNAAIYYLQAMAGAEQTNARRLKEDFEREQVNVGRQEGKEIGQVPPEVWRNMAPSELPVKEVQAYLQFSDWQRRFLAEAVKRESCDFDRHIREEDQPLMYLLPEVQQLRSLARLQNLRFLFALAESDQEEAIAILGQMYGLGHHMSFEPFLVSNLVGVACAAIGWEDSFYLSEDPEAPNLYWAYAALPQPLVSMQKSLEFERDILFESFERLREVTLEPKSDQFWQTCVDDLAQLVQDLGIEGLPQIGNAEDTRLALATGIAASYPVAMKFLVVEAGMDLDELKSLSKSHVFFLAMRQNYEIMRDEIFKAQYVAFPQRQSIEIDDKLEANAKEYGLIGWASDSLLPAIHAASEAQVRLQQKLAMAQTIEAIRDYMARYDGNLPQTLNELYLPAPLDPSTGEAFGYQLNGKQAILQGSRSMTLQYQFVISRP